MTKHVIHCIFAVCVSMGLLLLMIGMADSVPNAGGQPHAEHPGMVIGADGAARLAHIGSLAFMFNSLLLTLVVGLCVLGACVVVLVRVGRCGLGILGLARGRPSTWR